MTTTIIFQFILAILFGAAVGLERESSSAGDASAGGIRTYTLVALLGALAGLFYISGYVPIALIIITAFFLVVLIYYILGSLETRKLGMTTELAVVFTFFIGFLPLINIVPLKLVVAFFVLLVLILSIKARTKQLVEGISGREIQSFISYAIIALVILPFLPNTAYTLADLPMLATVLEGFGLNLGELASLQIINPQRIWLIVALITGIDIFGYVLAQLIGQKNSFSLASFVGGFISSTSTTQSLALRSKKYGAASYLIGAAVLANLASFFQIFLFVGPLNARWLVYILPSLAAMIIAAAIMAWYFLRREGEHAVTIEKKEEKIFSLIPALKFAALLMFVQIFTKFSLIIFGESGFIISSVIASLAGIDAIVINLADMAGGAISYKFALLTLLLVSATNLASKTVYSFLQGDKRFAVRFMVAMIIITVASFTGLLLYS